MSVVAAAIVDSRNVFHQAAEAIGVPACPTVPGVRAAMTRFGFNVTAVHVGLALPRARDQQDLSRQHATNDAYRLQVLADGGEVLLGELHKKSGGVVEEKMVDCACCVRITRYVDEIANNRSNVQAILVLSKDIDLQPAVDYAVASGVPIYVAALDVVQRRAHPYVLLGPHAYGEITQVPGVGGGHGHRESLATLLHAGQLQHWTVRGRGDRHRLEHASGVMGRAAAGVPLPSSGASLSLHPVDVDFSVGSAPVLVCSTSPSPSPAWETMQVIRRTGPMQVLVKRSNGSSRRLHFHQGGVVPGDTILVHRATERCVGRLPQLSGPQLFDPNVVSVVRVTTRLPNGGALATDSAGQRGLLTTTQPLRPGQRVAAVQLDLNSKGPVWSPVSSPLS